MRLWRGGTGGSRRSPVRAGRSVFATGEFVVLWASAAQSVVGDQLARVALSVLVFQRTGSAALTAGMYALTQLPALVSGVFLAGLADRFPRRAVMVVCDLARAALLAVMAVPAVPLVVLPVLVVVAQLAEAPFAAAQGATLPLILPGQRLERGQRVLLITHQTGLLIGFGVGGVVVAWLGVHAALAVDAGTFVVSAILVRIGVVARPAANGTADGQRVPMRCQVRDGVRLIWMDRRLRALVALAWLAGFAVVPEGLAAPFVSEVGAGAPAVGWLLAADPAGTVLGAWILGRLRIDLRLRMLGLLAVGTAVPMLFYLVQPSVAGALVILGVSGACSAYQVTASAVFIRLVPDQQRGQALGLARSGLIASQGLGVFCGGLLAQWVGSASSAVAIAGIVGTVAAANAAAAWSRVGADHVAAALSTDH